MTLEPCSHTGRTPPCADALIAAGIAGVHCATTDPNPRVAGKGLERLRAAGLGVSVGTLQAPARALNAGFFSRFERARPFVRLKLAMSLDARTAQADGVKAWISGPEARADVQRWRARSSAILTGAGTVLSDDPRLDVRLAYGPWVRQPLRVVLDSDLRCDPAAKLFQGDGALVFAAADGPGTERLIGTELSEETTNPRATAPKSIINCMLVSALGGGLVMWGKWIFEAMEPPHRLVVRQSFSDANGGITVHPMSPSWPRVMHSTTTLTPHGAETSLRLEWTPFQATPVEIDTFAHAHDNLRAGWSGTFEQLERYLARAGKAP